MKHLDEGRLQEWVDRSRSGLEAAEVDAIQRHLAECDECSALAKRLSELERQTRALLSSSTPTDDLPDFGAVRGRALGLETGRRRRRLAQGSAWAASIVIAIGVGWAANEMAGGGAQVKDDALSAPMTEQAEGPGRRAAPPPTNPTEEASAVMASAVDEGIDSGRPVEITREATTQVDASPTLPPAPTVSSEAIEVDLTRLGPTEVRRPVAAIPEMAAVEVIPVSTAGPRVLRGRVTDESGAPIEAAQVFVDGTRIGALTSSDGTYQLSLGDSTSVAQARPLTLMVQRLGYREESLDLIARGGATVLDDVRLSEQSLALEEIVVTGTTGARPAPMPEPPPANEVGRDATAVIVGPADWAPRTRTEAEASVGFAIMSLPGRPIEAIAAESFQGVPVSRVIQILDGGAEVVFLQSRHMIRVTNADGAGEGVTSSTTRDGFFLLAIGRLDAESLDAVLARVR